MAADAAEEAAEVEMAARNKLSLALAVAAEAETVAAETAVAGMPAVEMAAVAAVEMADSRSAR